MVVLFDFDEVFVDLNTGALKYINKELGTNYTDKDVTSWEFFDNPEIRKPFFDYLSLPDVYQKHVIPNKKMIKVLEQMVEMGKEVYIVTASVESSQESKYKFIKEHMSFFDTKNLFTVNGSSKYKMKSDVLEELNLDYHNPTVLVDDGIHNILDMMADINHKDKLDGMMKQFYISRTIKKFNNPYHDFIYGIVPELNYNKDIEGGKRIFKLKETKDIWKLLEKIDETHKSRVQSKQAELFNYINNIVNDWLPSETFKEVNELQNNVSFLTKSLLVSSNKNADFISDIARLTVKVETILTINGSTKEVIENLFKATDSRYGNDAMYNEIKDLVILNTCPELFTEKVKDSINICKKYNIENANGTNNLTKEIIDISKFNMFATKKILSDRDNDVTRSQITSLLHKAGLAYEVDFTDKTALAANITLAFNKNNTFNPKSGIIEIRDEQIEDLKKSLLSINKRPAKRPWEII